MNVFYFTYPPWARCFLLHQQNSGQVWARRPGLSLSKREPDPPVRVPKPSLTRHDTDPFTANPFGIGQMSELVVFVDGFTKRPQPQCRKNLACCLSAQQQQPMFWACCPVPGLGGVIRPSAPHQHERFMFILDQSVCLFIKGFDHSTPWPPGSSYPPCWSHPVHTISRKFENILCFYLLNCSSYSFSPL